MATTSSSQPQTINVSDLDVPQLKDVKRQLDEELQHLSTSFQQLKAAQAKFRACVENVAEIKPANRYRTILVPLTNSLYVPGKLNDLENVIVDVGTGYYVKKSRADAQKHYAGKIDYIKGNLEKLQESLAKKQDNLQYVATLIVAKEQNAASGGKEAS